MKKNATLAALAGIALCVFGAIPCSAQQGSGGIPIRIPNGPDPLCINGATDQVWLTLYRVIMTKKSSWFITSNQAEIVATVQVKTKPQSSQSLSYPLSSKVNIRDYRPGQVSIPVEYTVVSGLSLKQKDILYTGLAIDTTVMNVRSQSAVGATLSALTQLTGSQKLPIPDSPYTQAAGYLLDFANTAVNNEINSQNADDKYTTASLALNFDPDGTCSGLGPNGQGFETTGTKAILMSDGIASDGYVPIDQAGDYCWGADTTPAFVVKAARKVANKPSCSDPFYTPLYKPVTNNYVAYFLQKRTSSNRLGMSEVQRDVADSTRLCALLDVSECPGAK